MSLRQKCPFSLCCDFTNTKARARLAVVVHRSLSGRVSSLHCTLMRSTEFYIIKFHSHWTHVHVFEHIANRLRIYEYKTSLGVFSWELNQKGKNKPKQPYKI
ncbi:hypothetical protein TRVL_08807 [Trypanosoma vivax]|nr:hypothetical protein TRVL_08807 [Trypanosoma vivax]